MDTKELLTTHVRDPKSGKIVAETPYIMHCNKDSGIVFEKGGKRYYLSGELVDKSVALKEKKEQLEKAKAEFDKMLAEVEGKVEVKDDTTKSASTNSPVVSQRKNSGDFPGVR
jgi:hypothetical protein